MKWEAIDRLPRECCKLRAARPLVRAGFEAELQRIIGGPKGRNGSLLHRRRARVAADGSPDGAQRNPGTVLLCDRSRIALRSIRATRAAILRSRLRIYHGDCAQRFAG